MWDLGNVRKDTFTSMSLFAESNSFGLFAVWLGLVKQSEKLCLRGTETLGNTVTEQVNRPSTRHKHMEISGIARAERKTQHCC